MSTEENTRPNKDGNFYYTSFNTNGDISGGSCETLDDAVAMCKFQEQFGNTAYCKVRDIKESREVYISHIPFFIDKFKHVKSARIYQALDGKNYVGFPIE